MVDAPFHLKFRKTSHFGDVGHVQIDHGEEKLLLLVIGKLGVLYIPWLMLRPTTWLMDG